MAVMTVAESFSPIGWHIRELMNRKRVRDQKELAQIVTRGGYLIEQPAISKIIRGKQQATPPFVSALARGLNLNQTERDELAAIFAYGERNDADLTDEERRSVDDFEEGLDD